jgi:hypothetical protein
MSTMASNTALSSLPTKHPSDPTITLNIGGHIYTTLRSTIENNVDRQSFLSRIIDQQSDVPLDSCGRYFIDRNGEHFHYILNYFRYQKFDLPENIEQLKDLLREVQFYQIDRLINEIENRLNRNNECQRQYDHGYRVTLMSHGICRKALLKYIGPLQILACFPLEPIGMKFLRSICTCFDLDDVSCQLTFPCDEQLISCQVFDQLQRFVFAKQAKLFGLSVSYSDDYFYLPIQCTTIFHDQLTSFISNEYNGHLLHRTIDHDQSNASIEYWFLPKKIRRQHEQVLIDGKQ